MALKSKIRHRISRSQGKTRKKTRVRSQDKSMTRRQPLKLQLYDQLLLLLLPECLNTAVSLSHFGEWWNGSTCKLAVSDLSAQPGKELAVRGQGKRRWRRRRRRQRMMLQLNWQTSGHSSVGSIYDLCSMWSSSSRGSGNCSDGSQPTAKWLFWWKQIFPRWT